MKLNTYEGMFLFDPAAATRWEAVETEIGRIMQRAGAELIGVKKWDERRLTYEIQHRRRGCFVLTYFRAPGSGLAGIERDAQLSEMILRLLVLRCKLNEDHLEEFRKQAAEQSALLRSKPAAGPDEDEKTGAGGEAPAVDAGEAKREAPVGTGDAEAAADEAPPAEATADVTEHVASTGQDVATETASEPADKGSPEG